MPGLPVVIQRRMMAGLATIVMALDSAPARAQHLRYFDIAAGPAEKTIPLFAKQAGVQIIGSAASLKSKRTRAVKGRFTVEEALRRLLSDTGLGQTARDKDVITIGVVPRESRPRPNRATNRPLPIPASRTALEPARVDHIVGVAEILVVGTASRNVDVRRTENDAQPYVVYDREDMASSQAATVEEFLRTRLPQNSGAGSQAQLTGNGTVFSSFNLRGLGTNQTLILVNGRRLPELANQNFRPLQADINGIPVGSIDRIEVRPASASGIYGGNAVGGVINIVLRSDYRGLDVVATYMNTGDFRTASGRLDVNGGFALEGGTTTISFGGSLSRSDTLRVGDRVGLIKNGIDLGRQNISPYSGTGIPPLGNGVNIGSATGSNLVLDPEYGAASLGSNITNLPLGYAGVASDNGAALITGAGKLNLDMPTGLSGARRGLLSSPEIDSLHVSARRKFSGALDVYVDYSRFSNRGRSFSHNQLPVSLTLAANSPNNPFQQQIRLSFPNPDYNFPYRSKSLTQTLSGGGIIRLPRQWAVNAEYNRTWSANSAVVYNIGIDAFGQYCGLQATTDPLTCKGRPPLDPLQSPIDYGPYLFAEPTYRGGPYRSMFDNPSVRASGPLFHMSGRPVNLTLAFQREATSFERTQNRLVDPVSRAPVYVTFPGRSQRTHSGYAEVVLPLAVPSDGLPLLREVEFRAAVRHDRYLTRSPPVDQSSFVVSDPNTPFPDFTQLEARFRSTNFTLAGRYSPFEGIMIRASFATGFLPPNVVQLARVSDTAPFGLGRPDPFRGNEIIDYPLTSIEGDGNEALRPEKSSSVTLGAIVTPAKRLRVSIDYTRISKRDEIGGIPVDYLLANPDLFADRVVRGAPQSGDPPGYAGRITSIDISPINQFRSRFEAVDFQVGYERESERFGNIRLYALGSWQPDTVRQLVSGRPALNYSGNSDGPLEWQGNAGFDWSYGRLGVRWNTQFYDSYNVHATYDPTLPSGAGLIASSIRLQGRRRIPSQSYSDLYVTYDFQNAHGVLNGVQLSAGIQNIFNKTPPVVAIQSFIQSGYSTYGDPRLRRFTLSLRKSFGVRRPEQ